MAFSDQVGQQVAELEERKKTLSGELKEIEQELKALYAYMKAKGGKPRRTGVRQIVLEEVRRHDSVSRADLLKTLDVPSRSVDNALQALLKKGHISHENGLYKEVRNA